MSNIKGIRVWDGSCRDPNAIHLVTDPVANIDELRGAIEVARQNMWTKDDLPFEFVYRGQDAGFPLLPRQIIGRHRNLQDKLRQMLSICREAMGPGYTDHQVYFMMRHAGLPSHLLDWSWQWEIALWFAIHEANGGLKDRASSLWVLRPLLRDLQGGMFAGSTVPPVFFRADQQTCARSRRQDGSAYQVRFEKFSNEVLPVPMDNDPLYRERLLEIPLTVEMCCESIESELLHANPAIADLIGDDSPVPKTILEKCRRIFYDREEDADNE